MILKMKQEHSPAEGVGVKIEYGFYKSNEKIASFYADNRPIMLPAKFEGEYKGENTYKVILEKNEICPEGCKEGMLTFQFKKEDGTKVGISKYDYNHYNSNNEIIGTIKYISVSPKKKLFEAPKAYNYQEFTFKGQKYDMYDVRMRGTGIFYCIYKDSELVAMIEKYLTVVNWLDNYTIYALDEIDSEFLFLAAAHNDYLNFEEEIMPQGQVYHRETGVSTIEYRKDILDKYDPDFKQKIMEMEK